jgi:hypothetical protein
MQLAIVMAFTLGQAQLVYNNCYHHRNIAVNQTVANALIVHKAYLALRLACMPALAIVTVCCSITS